MVRVSSLAFFPALDGGLIALARELPRLLNTLLDGPQNAATMSGMILHAKLALDDPIRLGQSSTHPFETQSSRLPGWQVPTFLPILWFVFFLHPSILSGLATPAMVYRW
jgi:hypothetical protein